MEKLTDKLIKLREDARIITAESKALSINDDALEKLASEIGSWGARQGTNPVAANSELTTAQKVGLTLIFGAVNYCFIDPATGKDYEYMQDGVRYARSTGFVRALMTANIAWDNFAEIANITEQQWREILHLDDVGVVLYDANERIRRLGAFSNYLAEKILDPTTFFVSYPTGQAVDELLQASGMFEDEFIKRSQVTIVWIDDIARMEDTGFDSYIQLLTALPDYRLPQLLVELGVIKLSPEAEQALTAQLTDESIERAIRAATVTVCARVSRKSSLTEAQIDRLLWNKSQQLVNSSKMKALVMRVATRRY